MSDFEIALALLIGLLSAFLIGLVAGHVHDEREMAKERDDE